jgi:hypothetical protein
MNLPDRERGATKTFSQSSTAILIPENSDVQPVVEFSDFLLVTDDIPVTSTGGIQ